MILCKKYNQSKVRLRRLLLYCFPKPTAGLTLLEIMITLTLYMVAFLGLFQMFNVALNTNDQAGQESIATNLARGLMTEIMTRAFVDPENPWLLFLGPNTAQGEISTDRATFDDIDDYAGYSESPPKTLNGISMDGSGGTPDFSEFTRSVSVVYCKIDGVSIVSNGTTPIEPYKKMITVTVSGPGFNDVSVIEIRADLNSEMNSIMRRFRETVEIY